MATTHGFTIHGAWRHSTIRRSAVIMATMVAVLAGGMSPTLAAPGDTPANPKAASDLPALVSPPAPKPKPRVPAGDYANPPSLAQAAGEQARSKVPSFDPLRSRVVDAETSGEQEGLAQRGRNHHR